ncbi:MAG: hypothetical protein KIS96_14530 [Bauldia sp.]|nr:hypothetical protein [Bauldia sp.]
MALLIRDFPIGVDDAAAVLGNWGHECGGFLSLQEISPTIPNSRGGYGWPQWTGPRRRNYEAYCKRNGLDPASDRANYGFAFAELKGPERKAIPALQGAKGLAAKVKAFELAYERAGKKHYDSRNRWASIAIEAWHDAGGASAVKIPEWALPAAGKPASAFPAPPAPEPPRPAEPLPGPPVRPPDTIPVTEGGFSMNSNLFHNILTGAMVASAAVTAGLLATGCTTDVAGAIECSGSIIDPRWTSGVIAGLGLVKTGINLWRDGLAGLYKPQPKIK